MLPYVVGARTATSTKKFGKTIKSPEDFVGIKFRIPGSKSLKNFYSLTKAKPRTVAWKLCAVNAENGRFDALDPAIAGLYSGPNGLRDHLGVISDIETVQDGWVGIANIDCLKSLDGETKKEFNAAWEKIQVAQRGVYETCRDNCTEEFKKLGTKVYVPTKAEKDELAKQFGHTHSSWDPIKKNLLGDDGLKVFDEFYKVANS